MLDGMYVTKSISTGLYPNLDLWTANKLQLQLLRHTTIPINKCSLVSPGSKHSSATNIPQREISSVSLCARSYSTVPLGLINQ